MMKKLDEKQTKKGGGWKGKKVKKWIQKRKKIGWWKKRIDEKKTIKKRKESRCKKIKKG